MYCYFGYTAAALFWLCALAFFAYFLIESSVDGRRDRTYIIVVKRVSQVYFGVHLNCEQKI